MGRNNDVITFFFQNTFVLRWPGLDNFTDIIKIAIIFINTKELKKKELEITY